MGKRRKLKKRYRKLAEEARRLTWPKALRLAGKTFLLVLGTSLLITAGIVAGLEWLKSTWVQIGVYAAAYFLAYRWLMSDFLPPPPDRLAERRK